MAKITQEKIEQINELFCELGVKSQVAKIVGCSPATVTKYIIKDYIPKAQRKDIKFDIEMKGCKEFLLAIQNRETTISFSEIFEKTTTLTTEEKEELEKLKKEIFI